MVEGFEPSDLPWCEHLQRTGCRSPSRVPACLAYAYRPGFASGLVRTALLMVLDTDAVEVYGLCLNAQTRQAVGVSRRVCHQEYGPGLIPAVVGNLAGAMSVIPAHHMSVSIHAAALLMALPYSGEGCLSLGAAHIPAMQALRGLGRGFVRWRGMTRPWRLRYRACRC